MTAWHQYKTNFDLSRNKLHHGGGGGSKTPFVQFLVNRQIIQTIPNHANIIDLRNKRKSIIVQKTVGWNTNSTITTWGVDFEETCGGFLNRNWWWFPAMSQEAREIPICGITELSALEDADEHQQQKFQDLTPKYI